MDSFHFAPKQIEFIQNANRMFNLSHGSVRAGKTICSFFKFLAQALVCPGESIAIIGYTIGSIYSNLIQPLLIGKELKVYRDYATWKTGAAGRKELRFGNRRIICIGAGDEGALGLIQGITLDLVYCDEMTLYPENVIEMIKTRLSRPHSQLYASMNPKHPSHKLKEWIDRAPKDPLYYSLHFTVDDNPFIPDFYKENLKNTLSGVYYKRLYLGQWCVAEGAIFDFFDQKYYVVPRPPRAADYFIVGMDYGTNAPFAALLIGVSTGRHIQEGKVFWVQDEYYWDSNKEKRQKVNSEYADDMQRWLEPYNVKAIYADPSAASMKEELRRRGLHVVDANNDIGYGIEVTIKEMKLGNVYILPHCKNLIREIEGYVWDKKKAEKGEDLPKEGGSDHACDALRYAIASHKVSTYTDLQKKQAGETEFLPQSKYYPRLERYPSYGRFS